VARKLVSLWILNEIIERIVSDKVKHFLRIVIAQQHRVAVKRVETNFVLVSCQGDDLAFPTPGQSLYKLLGQFPGFEEVMHNVQVVVVSEITERNMSDLHLHARVTFS
jgi:hypothetical protein